MTIYYDEDGSPIDGSQSLPTIPPQTVREVELSIKDKEEDNYAKIDADGNLQVVVTDMPPIIIDTSGLEINVEVQNQVEVTNAEGDPIPVSGTVAISNPVTEVTVSGTVDVGNLAFPATQNVNVENTNLNVTVSNPTESVTVSGSVDVATLPPIAITNENLNVTVSNPTTEVSVTGSVDATITNTDLSVTFTNTTIDVGNFPDPVTEVSVSNLLSAEEIAQAQKEYLERRYTIYDDVATFYADSVKPQPDPFGRDGMHFKNDHTNGISHLTQANFPTYTQAQLDTAKKKINWYFYDPQVQTPTTYANFKNAWALVTMDRTKTPFFYIYGSSNGTSVTSAWVFSGHSTTIEVGKTYLIWFGTEEPTVFPEYQRIQLAYNPGSSYGTRNPNEIILSIAYTSNSSDAVNTTEFQTYFLGFKTINANRFVKLGVKAQNATSVVGSVEITNDSGNAIPVSGTVTVANPVTDVNATIVNTSPIAVSGDVNATVSGSVTVDTTTPLNVSGTVTVDVLPDVTIANEELAVVNATTELGENIPLDVTVLNPITDVNATIVNEAPIPISGDVTATVSGSVTVDTTTPLNVSGTVSVDVLPDVTIANETLSVVNATTELGENIPLDVTVLNPITDVNATIVNEAPIAVSGDVSATVSGSVTVDTTTPLNVSATVVNTEPIAVSGTVLVDTATPLSVTVSNTDLPVTFSNTSIEVTGTVTANVTFPETQNVDGTVNVVNAKDELEANIPLDVNITNELTITPPENQNVTVTNTIDAPVVISPIAADSVVAEYTRWVNPADPNDISYEYVEGWIEQKSYETTSLYNGVTIRNPVYYQWNFGSDREGWLQNRDKSPETYGATLLGADPLAVYIDPNFQPISVEARSVITDGTYDAGVSSIGEGVDAKKGLNVVIVGSIDGGNWNAP